MRKLIRLFLFCLFIVFTCLKANAQTDLVATMERPKTISIGYLTGNIGSGSDKSGHRGVYLGFTGIGYGNIPLVLGFKYEYSELTSSDPIGVGNIEYQGDMYELGFKEDYHEISMHIMYSIIKDKRVKPYVILDGGFLLGKSYDTRPTNTTSSSNQDDDKVERNQYSFYALRAGGYVYLTNEISIQTEVSFDFLSSSSTDAKMRNTNFNLGLAFDLW